MNQAWLFSIGIRVVTAALVLVSLSTTTLTHASEGPNCNRFVPVMYDGLVRYTLDATTMKRHTGLSGKTLIDVWLEGRLDAGAGSRIQAVLGGYPPGVDYEKVGTVRMRYLFKIDGSTPEQEASAAVVERQYFDLNGVVIRHEPFNPPRDPSEWHSLNETEEKALLAILKESAFQAAPRLDPVLLSSAAVKDLDEGFLGWPWGTRPGDLASARHIADIASDVMVFGASLDLSPILGPVSAYAGPHLVFTKEGGLIKARIAFDPHDYDLIQGHLVRALGEPAPIIYELWAARVDFDQRSEWRVGRNTRVVLTSWLSGATVEIGRRDSFSPEGRSFEETLAAAQLRQALEFERQNRIVEALSVYQELLSGTDSYRFYTATAQERLATYSGRDDAVEFLGKAKGYGFSWLRNIYPDITGQHWLRIDLNPEARKELQKQRPSDIKQQDRLADIFAALCRVKAVPAAGKYSVVEQVWLDGSNRIIGGRPAWALQDVVWPAPYIRQACEDFLEAWFTASDTAGPATKDGKGR